MEYQLLDRMSYQRFCGLSHAVNIPDRTTIWTFENRIGETGAKTAVHLGSCAECGRGNHVAAGFTENLGLFEVPLSGTHRATSHYAQQIMNRL